MKVFTKKSTSEDMRPTKAAQQLVAKLGSTSGWRARQEIGLALQNARITFAATTDAEERGEWLTLLDYIAEGIEDAIALRATVKLHLAANKPTPPRTPPHPLRAKIYPR